MTYQTVRVVEFEGDVQEIRAVACTATPITASFDRAEADALQLLGHLKRELVEMIRHEALNPDGAGALLIKGVDIGDAAPPTPLPGERIAVPPADQILLAVASLLGTCVGYKGEHSGWRFQDIVPHEEHRQVEGGVGSEVVLRGHMENVEAGAARPDAGILLCLRHEQAHTPVSDVRWAVSQCSEAARQELRKAQFRNPVPNSWGLPAGTSFGPYAIIDQDGGLWYDDIDCAAETAGGAAALAELQRGLATGTDYVLLEPGDALLLFHRRVIHGRTAFTPHADPKQRRWLRRVHIVSFCGRIPGLSAHGVIALS